MSCITRNFTIYLPTEGSFEKRIHDEIHSSFIANCIRFLCQGYSITLPFARIYCPFSELSENAQTYLLSQNCSKERTVEVILNVEESLLRIQEAFSKGLVKELLYRAKGQTKYATDDCHFLGYKLTYHKP